MLGASGEGGQAVWGGRYVAEVEKGATVVGAQP